MSKKPTLAIIDDVQSAIDVLQQLLQDLSMEFTVVGTAQTVVSGARLVQETRPDVILLDIEMPDGSGFDLIDLLPDDIVSRVIFTTGSEDYAIKAFKYAAVDYLLKPVDPDDLHQALLKAYNGKSNASTIRSVMSNKDETGLPTKLALHTAEEVRLVEIADIVRCQSMDNYCRVYLKSNEQILISKPLKFYSDLLEPSGFIRTHQSHLVNFDYIRAYVKKEGGYLELKDQTMVPVSIRKRAELLDRLSG